MSLTDPDLQVLALSFYHYQKTLRRKFDSTTGRGDKWATPKTNLKIFIAMIQ